MDDLRRLNRLRDVHGGVYAASTQAAIDAAVSYQKKLTYSPKDLQALKSKLVAALDKPLDPTAAKSLDEIKQLYGVVDQHANLTRVLSENPNIPDLVVKAMADKGAYADLAHVVGEGKAKAIQQMAERVKTIESAFPGTRSDVLRNLRETGQLNPQQNAILSTMYNVDPEFGKAIDKFVTSSGIVKAVRAKPEMRIPIGRPSVAGGLTRAAFGGFGAGAFAGPAVGGVVAGGILVASMLETLIQNPHKMAQMLYQTKSASSMVTASERAQKYARRYFALQRMAGTSARTQ
jgi:hypothetical protein